MITSRIGADGLTFVEGRRYGASRRFVLHHYFVGTACAAAAVLFGLVFLALKLANDPKSVRGTLIGFASFLVLGLLSFYVFADDTVLRAYEASGIKVSTGESLFAGGGVLRLLTWQLVHFNHCRCRNPQPLSKNMARRELQEINAGSMADIAFLL